MAFLTKIEAAIALGVGVDLLDWFIKKCPKPGEDRTLVTIKVGTEEMIDEAELAQFQQYLREPWPVKIDKTRPTIPDKIKTDVKQESHLACAICGHMDNGEVAHIEAVKKTYNNSPDNLIFLCPNHHTKFDLGFKPRSNVTEDEVRAAKLIKRQSRARIMRVEADVTRALVTVLDLIRRLKKRIDDAEGKAISKVYLVEMKNLLKHSAQLGEKVASASKSGTANGELQKHLNQHAPTIAKLSAEGLAATSDRQMKAKVRSLVEESHDVVEALDEVDCPRCNGRGTTGLNGDWCKYCRGSQQVSHARAEAYDPNDIDEEECPHCNGVGTVGLCGDYCAYCRGSQFVSSDRAAEYSPADIDERACPRCDGRGTTGLVGDFCAYCRGSCVVSLEKWSEYEPDEIDEVACPRCDGNGTTGLNGDFCAFCKGSQVVTKAKADAYDEDTIGEVECPHCNGRGTTGLNGTYCSFCRGSQVISEAKAERYDPDEIDEVMCPRCGGQGTTGYAGDICKLCKGEQTVTAAKAHKFEASNRNW
ncbi:hypothetical protein ISI15_16395 [Burkholderia pseudomallei]|nr:hypothetical protein [Burkholderia pseudomallei]